MSASSNCVTCGTVSHARWRLRAETRRSLLSGCTSTAPHFEKSISGIAGTAKPAGAAGWVPDSRARFT